MNIDVTKDEVIIDKNSDKAHENEYKITECHFTFDDFTNSFQVKRAIFTILSTGEKYEIDIINNRCDIPIEVLGHAYETVKLGVYGYNIEIVDEEETLKERFSPSYDTFVVPTGSYEDGALSPEIITPSQYDIYSQALQEGLDDVAEALEEVSHVDIDASKSGRTATITITNRNNEEKSVDVSDGISIENVEIADNHLWVTYNEPTETQDLGQVVPIKGQDYFTTAEIEQIESETKEQVKTDLDFDNTVARIDSDIQDLNSNKASKTELEQEISARELADTSLQGQIDAITSSKDVVDIVGTYSDLQNYDTSTLTEDDVIKVLDDSTHNNAMSYYRWSNNTWTYIGSEGPFYTKGETDARLNTKQATIDNSHKLASDLVDDTNQTHKFTNENEKTTWNAKYDKPVNGIPKSDLVESVQESLNKADTAIQDVSDKEDKSNKVTEINSSSTDTQYPSAKCVYNSQEEQNEQITELEMLYNAFPTVSAENETIQLDNTAKVKFREIDLKGNTSQVVIPEEQGTSVSNTSIYVSDVNTDKENTIEMSGNTYQETTTGKNLLNTSTIEIGTKNGITTTYNSVTQEITFNGTCNTDNTQIVVSTNTITFINGTTKVIGYYVSGSLTNSGVFRTFSSGWTNYDGVNIYQLNSSNPIIVRTTTFNADKNLFSFRFDNGAEATNFKIKLMITDSNDTTFEKFTYCASPNPDYPQNIEVVTGTQNVNIYGKNLFNKNNVTSGKRLDSNGDLYNDSMYSTSDFIKISSSSDYSFTKLNGSEAVCTYDNNKTFIRRLGFSSQEHITTRTSEVYFRVCISNSRLDIWQLERGSQSTTYEEYQGTTYPINLGKNLFDKDNAMMLDNYYINGSGGFTASNGFHSIYLPCEPNTTYTISWISVNPVNKNRCRIATCNTTVTSSSTLTLLFNGTNAQYHSPQTITTPYDAKYLVFDLIERADATTITTLSDLIDSIQVEKGSTATDYAPYFEPIELCKIDTYQDRIYKQNDKWYLEKNIGKETRDGSKDEGWGKLNREINGCYGFRHNGSYSEILICDKLTNYTAGQLYNGAGEGIGYSPTGSYLAVYIKAERVNSYNVSALRTFLSNNPITFYYQLSTPITTEITDTTLISQLNALYNAQLYPITNINTDTNNLLPYIDLTYNKVTPSPSPSRPSVVNVVKGNNTITIANSDNTESQVFPINLGDMELCKIGTYQDYIYESNGNWYLKKKIDKKNENSFTEIYIVTSTLANNLYGYTCNTQGLSSYSELGATLSNIFAPKILGSQTDTTNPNNVRFNMGIAKHTNTNQVVITIDKKYLDTGTTTEFSNFLNNNDFEYYCVLETSTDTQITDTTLITQLNNIKKAYSYDTQTNISQINADKPFIINAEAILSLKNIFNS